MVSFLARVKFHTYFCVTIHDSETPSSFLLVEQWEKYSTMRSINWDQISSPSYVNWVLYITTFQQQTSKRNKTKCVEHKIKVSHSPPLIPLSFLEVNSIIKLSAYMCIYTVYIHTYPHVYIHTYSFSPVRRIIFYILYFIVIFSLDIFWQKKYIEIYLVF